MKRQLKRAFSFILAGALMTAPMQLYAMPEDGMDAVIAVESEGLENLIDGLMNESGAGEGTAEPEETVSTDGTVEPGGTVITDNQESSADSVERLLDSTYDNPTDETVGTKPQDNSLLPLDTTEITVDLTDYTPVELTMVKFEDIFKEVELNDKENLKVCWTYGGNDYTVSEMKDTVNLFNHSRLTAILGDGDQLNPDNKKFIVEFEKTYTHEWLNVDVRYDNKTETSDSFRPSDSYTSSWGTTIVEDRNALSLDVYIDLASGDIDLSPYLKKAVFSLNNDKFPNRRFSKMEIAVPVSGSEAESVTEGAWESDIDSPNTGVEIEDEGILIFRTYDASGALTGELWAEIDLTEYYPQEPSEDTSDEEPYVSFSFELYTEDGDRADSGWREEGENERDYLVYTDINYKKELYLRGKLYGSQTVVDAAYVGKFETIEQAGNSKAEDIKNALFRSDEDKKGYKRRYDGGVTFSIFVNGKPYHYIIKAVEGYRPSYDLSDSTAVRFTGLRDQDGNPVEIFKVSENNDSYGEQNFVTIFVPEGTDVTKLAPEFVVEKGLTLYAEGGSKPEKSGESLHNFSKGAVHYTASAENKEDSKNYWLRIIKSKSGKGELYITSLEDKDSKTQVKKGVTYTTREVILDSLHGYRHDIFLANIGGEDIKDLKAEIDSDALYIDRYWDLNGKFDLKAISLEDVKEESLWNMAKISVRPDFDGVGEGRDVSGTLTIKSGDTTLMVIKLTGTVGDPQIITKTIPDAVKYVPYGVFIQNNNKYSWNKVSYVLTDGTLPKGMEIKPNGELYGVPSDEPGEYTFTVRMNNSNSAFKSSSRTFTLTVMDNTDDNVDNATDGGYELTERVTYDLYEKNLKKTYLMVSIGEHDEFVDLYLDGDKLQPGVDYDHESGSTRITINSQTLASKDVGRHTLGIEFRQGSRDGSEKELKRAAQNYVYHEGGTSNKPSSDSGGSDDSDSPSGGSTTPSVTTPAVPTAPAATILPPAMQPLSATANPAQIVDVGGAYYLFDGESYVSYTVAPGDTLWSIAAKFYGKGDFWTKIYEGNQDVLRNPDLVVVGQVLRIYEARVLPGNEISQGNPTTDTGIYTVQSGDTLWSIAKRHYGNGRRWRQIFEANTTVMKDANSLRAGQVIVIP